jgi:hypothetical protein
MVICLGFPVPVASPSQRSNFQPAVATAVISTACPVIYKPPDGLHVIDPRPVTEAATSNIYCVSAGHAVSIKIDASKMHLIQSMFFMIITFFLANITIYSGNVNTQEKIITFVRFGFPFLPAHFVFFFE